MTPFSKKILNDDTSFTLFPNILHNNIQFEAFIKEQKEFRSKSSILKYHSIQNYTYEKYKNTESIAEIK